MEIPDEGGFEMVQVPKGGSGVADEGSITDITLPKGVGSIPRNSISGQTSDASSPNGFDLEIKQMFEMKEKLQPKFHEVAVHGNFEYKVVKSNKLLYVMKYINKNCKWWVRGSKLSNLGL